MSTPPPGTVRLRRDDAVVELEPSAGGTLTRYAVERSAGPMDWLRPASDDAICRHIPTGTACFPLVPFSNRIGYGRFPFHGAEIELPPNFPPEPHTIHGHGWKAAWTVVDQAEDALAMTYRHAAGAWPFSYRVRQDVRLEPEGLALRMTITNEADAAMPLGFGWHPFFVRTPQTRVTAAVEQVWLAGEEALPERLVALPEAWSLPTGLRPDSVELDNNFVGWDGRARIDWPDREAALELETEGPFGVVVVYSPAGKDFVCVEPATNCIDAFNLAAQGREDTGMLVLGPGERISGSMRLRPVLT